MEKLRFLNEENGNYVAESVDYRSSPLQTNNSFQNLNNYSLNQSPNIYSTSQTLTNNVSQRQNLLVPPVLKQTINKIDKLTNETNELFNANLHLNSDSARKLISSERNKANISFNSSVSPSNMHNSTMNSKNHSSNNFLNLGNNFSSTSSLPQQQRKLLNHVTNMQQQQKNNCDCRSKTSLHEDKKQIPRRSYSSCGEPLNNENNANFVNSGILTRRCTSNRSSPIRQQPIQNIYQSNPKINQDSVRSRSHSRRSKSKSRSPVQQLYRREIKINVGNPKRDELNEEHHVNSNQMEERTVTTTSLFKQPQRTRKPSASLVSVNPIQPDVQEEVLLNLFSCNNSGSVSSDSSESLVEFEDPKLKINEVYEKKVEERKIFAKPTNNNNNFLLEKKLAELEKKLRRLPELEIKNNILLEEKQMLIKQLLNMKQQPPVVAPVEQPTKMYRSIGSNSNENDFRRDIGTECKATTREVGITSKLEEPREEIQKMETIITTLRDKLTEQTLILQQALVKPVTRDVAIMHVVDQVQNPKPEVRDVAINHRTEVDNKELIEKHTLITNAYIKEIETLRLENSKLSTNLEELIKKHSKHVITRGTHAPDQPIHYSVGTNTARTQTRDVQVMFTPKSRDVSLATDRFYNTRDVALSCTLGNIEQQEQMNELMDIKAKYELLIEEKLRQVKSYRDVAILCDLDFKELRSVSLGCNLIETKQMRDVSLKCNLDEEFRSMRDVNIGCNLDVKVQKDAWVMANTIPPPPHTKDCYTNVRFDDEEKSHLYHQLEQLKQLQNKATRDVGVFVDQRARLMEDQMRNQSSGMDTIRTSNSQVNTEAKSTKDFSVGTSFGDETYEYEIKTYKKQLFAEEQNKIQLENINSHLQDRLQLLEEELKDEKNKISALNTKFNSSSLKNYQANDVNKESTAFNLQSSSNTDLSALNDKIDIKISTGFLKKKDDNLNKRKETEYEEHKITKFDSKNKKLDETITMNFSATNKQGEKFNESATFTTSTPYAANTTMRTEMHIPITNESPSKFRNDIEIVPQVASEQLESKNAEKGELKKPKSILKTSVNENQHQKKALTFGENEIVDSYQSEQSGSDYSLSDQNVNLISNEEENEEDLYETPITTIGNQLAESAESRRMKTERANTNNLHDYDDYELQERLMTESLQSEKDQVTPSLITSPKPRHIETEQSQEDEYSVFELELELHIACAILNDSLYEPLKADKNKVARALNLIQQDWFKLAAKKDSNASYVEAHLNSFYTRFSNLLLERIVNMADLILNTALHYSVSNGNFEIVNLLLDTKVCDVNSQNKAGGYTSIMLAALVPVTNEYERMTLKRLFSEGNVNIKSYDNGQTALMLAVMHGNKDTVGLLLSAGSDCNLQDKEGSTALMAACEHGHIEIVRILLNNTNCDPDIKDNDGETAFDISKKKQRNDIIVLLYAHSSKLRSHHPAIQFSKSRPKFNSGQTKK